MATNTYVALGSYTVTGSNLYGPTGVTLTIPSGYTDMRIVFSGSVTAASITCLKFNNSSGGTDYSWTWVGGSGSSASSNRGANQPQTFLTNVGHMTASQGNILVDIMNYSNTSVYKTVLSRANNGGGLGVDATVSTWRSTAAVTSVNIFLDRAEYFVVGSTFTLYGIAAASVGAKATGGTIYQDASYFYHVFAGNGTFTPSQSLSADVLVVAGGGAGSGDAAGGGGAGGVIYFANQSLTTTGYTCTVGAGGASASTTNVANSGTNSTFASLTAAVGGGGGNASAASAAGSGGSGGGGGRNNSGVGGSSTQTGTGATAFYGNAGGTSSNSGYPAGGGGAGDAGSANSGGLSGAGGNGISAYNSWSQVTGIGQNVSGTYYLAGGGGGGGNSSNGQGAGGYGGGGAGGANANPGIAVSGTSNTGGGGGGGGGGFGVTNNGGNGGSGVIIVRYAK